jgi:hypothetical protein
LNHAATLTTKTSDKKEKKTTITNCYRNKLSHNPHDKDISMVVDHTPLNSNPHAIVRHKGAESR